MAAIIGGVSRLFVPTIGVLSGEKPCQGISPWYFLIGLRMVTLFFAFGPWESLKADVICQWPSEVGDAKAFCTAVCYNQHFPIPISAVWAFHFIAIIFTVALMNFVHISRKGTPAKDAEAAAATGSKPPPGTGGCCEPDGQPTFGGWRYRIFILCIVLILAMELSFIWILLALQSPIMSRGVVPCRPNNPACPPSGQCALQARSDKQALLWALAFCSAANAAVCVGYLATQAGQACGYCGSDGSSGKARFGGHANCGREAAGSGCRCNQPSCGCCQGGEGGRAEGYGYQTYGKAGIEGGRSKPEEANCCCPPRKDNWVVCGCQDNRQPPCNFQGGEAGQNSSASRADSEGKLLRGDTELESERKEWKPKIGRKEPLRIGVKKGQGSGGGRAVKYVAKYQAWGKQRV